MGEPLVARAKLVEAVGSLREQNIRYKVCELHSNELLGLQNRRRDAEGS